MDKEADMDLVGSEASQGTQDLGSFNIADNPIAASSSPVSDGLAPTLPDPELSPVRTWRGLDLGHFEFLPGVRNIPEDLLAAMEVPRRSRTPVHQPNGRAADPSR